MLLISVLVLVISTYYGVLNYVIMASVSYSLFKKVKRKQWNEVKKYTIFLGLLYLCNLLGINTLWLLLALLIRLLIKTKLLGLILKHPILTYENIYRQMEVAWSGIIIKSTFQHKSFDFVHRMNRESKQRIKEIEERGVKIEFLQKYYEEM